MDPDDLPIGRVLSRRDALRLLGALSAAALAACSPAGTASTPAPLASATAASAATVAVPTITTVAGVPTSIAAATSVATTAGVTSLPTCLVKPALTEGPYFVDEMLNRSDIRSDPSNGTVRDGAPLALAMRVSQIDGTACVRLAGAQVDIWHCDALGVYSDASDRSFNTQGQKFLRGYQVTDANGAVQFTTIYPGWYQGRAVHIHFKIRTNPQGSSGTEFTSQFFFDDALSNSVYAKAPYAAKGLPSMGNAQDGIFQGGGDQLLLAVTPTGDGYATTFDIGLQTA